MAEPAKAPFWEREATPAAHSSWGMGGRGAVATKGAGSTRRRPRQILRVKRRPNGRRVLPVCRGRCADVCPIRRRWATVWPQDFTLSIGASV